MKTTSTLHTIIAKLFILVSFLLFAAGTSKAQEQIEIVIVGSAHNNPGSPEKYRTVVEKLKRYNPDMITTEYMTPEDQKEALQLGYWGKEGFNKKYNYLTARNPEAAKKGIANTDKAYKSLDKFAYYHKTRINLARDLYLNHDRGNADYQIYILDQHMKKAFGKSELTYFEEILGPIDSLQKQGFIRKNSEYYKIFFPLAYELKHAKVYSMDVQKYDGPWGKAFMKADSLIKIMNAQAKADSTSPAGLAVKAIKAYYKDAEKRAGKVDFSSYEFMNTALYGEIDAAMNFYGGARFFNEPGFPAEPIQEMLVWWGKRNQAMCENTVREAKAQGAKRVVVAVGASHRQAMEEIFAKMPDVKVVNYNDLP